MLTLGIVGASTANARIHGAMVLSGSIITLNSMFTTFLEASAMAG
jgi:hypothetical protein